jgi:hypothetical protein
MDNTLTTSQSTDTAPPATRTSNIGQRLLTWLVPLLLFVIAFVARDVRLGAFSWPDEVTWTARSIAFYAGLAQGDLAATHQSDHPGVVPMWGFGGLLSLQALQRGELDTLLTMTTERQLQDIPALLATEALWTVLITSLTVVGIYLLLKRLLDVRVSFLAALMVALDPFYLVHSRVVHLDAILTSFMTLSTLALAVYLVHPARKRYLVLSAVMGGLAFATKSPSLVLLPLLLGGLVLRVTLHHDMPSGWAGGPLGRRLGWAALSALAWLGIGWVVFLALWPAAWLDPLYLTGRVVLGSRWGIVTSHQFNYFLGQVTETPGPLFYLVVAPFRMTPLVLIFAPLSVPLLVADLVRAWRRGLSPRLAILALALALVTGYMVGMSLSAKQGDRYLVAIYPMLDLLATLSLTALLGWIGQRWQFLADRRRQFVTALIPILLVTILWLPLAPYYGAYFNPLVGGGRVAMWAFPFGQGEGLDMVADYLNQKEDAGRLRVASFYPEELQAYFHGDAISLRRREWSKTWLFSDYVVFYISQVQRELPDAELVNFFRDREPEYVARIGDVTFAWVYKPPQLRSGAPPLVSDQIWAVFRDELALAHYDLGAAELPPGQPWDLTLHWQVQQTPQANYGVSVRFIGPDGRVAWQTEWRPFEDYFPTSWWPAGRPVYDRQTLNLPDSLVPGETYCLEVQLANLEDGTPVPLTVGGQGDWAEVICLPASPR